MEGAGRIMAFFNVVEDPEDVKNSVVLGGYTYAAFPIITVPLSYKPYYGIEI